jgi:hypothetical protein
LGQVLVLLLRRHHQLQQVMLQQLQQQQQLHLDQESNLDLILQQNLTHHQLLEQLNLLQKNHKRN